MHQIPIEPNIKPEKRDLIPYEKWRSDKRYSVFRLLDDSMSPEFEKGDVIIVKRKRYYKSGDLIAASIAKRYSMFRMVTLANGYKFLVPFNLNHRIVGFGKGSKNLKIIGKMVLLRRIYE